VEFCQFKIFFCCCSLQICNKCNPKTTHFSYHKTANGILWQFFVWLHFVTTSIADVLNAVACCAPFDIYTRCLFALEHVKREFDLIKGKLETMLEVKNETKSFHFDSQQQQCYASIASLKFFCKMNMTFIKQCGDVQFHMYIYTYLILGMW
jgi:hypothetical protein